ncbi:YihA family ribosome biogenesis GTP-binding protein, partial [Listeria monocytogenes]|nr:YihA family ribosome biogenesis GTP-binding protein [Listeria monocytogenes]
MNRTGWKIMDVNNVELIISAVRPEQYPETDLPEYAL